MKKEQEQEKILNENIDRAILNRVSKYEHSSLQDLEDCTQSIFSNEETVSDWKQWESVVGKRIARLYIQRLIQKDDNGYFITQKGKRYLKSEKEKVVYRETKSS